MLAENGASAEFAGTASANALYCRLPLGVG
jgi:hypothetical protein